MTYAMASNRKDPRSEINHLDLLFVWDRLTELIQSGKIQDIIEGQDDIDNLLAVYTVKDGALISTVTDAYGWPNTTIDGIIMHDNTYFKTAAEALETGLREEEYHLSFLEDKVVEKRKELVNVMEKVNVTKARLSALKTLQSELPSEPDTNKGN